MADSKITALTALTAADPVNDMFPVVDVSDTSMAASGTTKRISANNILSSSPTASGALTVTGLVTAGSATITGDLTVDTSTLKVDSTNNRVGIGTASPGYPLQVVGNAFFNADATCKRFFVNDTTGTANTYINSADGSTSNIFFGGQTNYNYGAIIYDDASDFLAFRANGAEAARFNSTGNLVLKGGTAAANGVGITFPATPVASSDANCLDDYEEGTWSPTPSVSMGNLTAVTSVSARYTKVGRIVTLSGFVTGTVTLPNLDTYFILLGLPFAHGSNTVGTLFENAGLKIGTTQVTSNNLYAYFPVPSAITAGAKDFYYEITYTV